MKIVDVRGDLSLWSTGTFGEWLKKCFWKDSKILRELGTQLTRLGIMNKRIEGYSVLKLERTQEGMGGGISYTETFYEIGKLISDRLGREIALNDFRILLSNYEIGSVFTYSGSGSDA